MTSSKIFSQFKVIQNMLLGQLRTCRLCQIRHCLSVQVTCGLSTAVSPAFSPVSPTLPPRHRCWWLLGLNAAGSSLTLCFNFRCLPQAFPNLSPNLSTGHLPSSEPALFHPWPVLLLPPSHGTSEVSPQPTLELKLGFPGKKVTW